MDSSITKKTKQKSSPKKTSWFAIIKKPSEVFKNLVFKLDHAFYIDEWTQHDQLKLARSIHALRRNMTRTERNMAKYYIDVGDIQHHLLGYALDRPSLNTDNEIATFKHEWSRAKQYLNEYVDRMERYLTYVKTPMDVFVEKYMDGYVYNGERICTIIELLNVSRTGIQTPSSRIKIYFSTEQAREDMNKPITPVRAPRIFRNYLNLIFLKAQVSHQWNQELQTQWTNFRNIIFNRQAAVPPRGNLRNTLNVFGEASVIKWDEKNLVKLIVKTGRENLTKRGL